MLTLPKKDHPEETSQHRPPKQNGHWTPFRPNNLQKIRNQEIKASLTQSESNLEDKLEETSLSGTNTVPEKSSKFSPLLRKLTQKNLGITHH
jgi:hypothetical protein